jgi:hypothetical protein
MLLFEHTNTNGNKELNLLFIINRFNCHFFLTKKAHKKWWRTKLILMIIRCYL